MDFNHHEEILTRFKIEAEMRLACATKYVAEKSTLEAIILSGYKAGMKTHDIANLVNAEGFRTIRGRLFTSSAVSKIANGRGARRNYHFNRVRL